MSKEMKQAYRFLRMKDFFEAIKMKIAAKFCELRIRKLGFTEIELESWELLP